MGARIRQAAVRKVPYVAVLGAREAASGSVSLRLRDGQQLDAMPIGDAISLVRRIAESRSHELV